MNEPGYVKQEFNTNGICTITFHHPKHNSFSTKQLNDLSSIITSLNQADTKVIILKSTGEGTFCSGASFDELLRIENKEMGKQFFSGFAHLINAIRSSEKLIIGQIQGKAIGGGVGLAAACDYCFATEQASIRLSELSINIGPFVIAPAVERKIGLPAFTELCLNPDAYKDAHWAKQKGLYQEIFPNLALMEEAVTQFCQRLGTYNSEALRAMKRILWENTAHWEELLYERAEISGQLVLHEETKKYLNNFKNKN